MTLQVKVYFDAVGEWSYPKNQILITDSIHAKTNGLKVSESKRGCRAPMLAPDTIPEDTPIFVHPKDPFKRVDVLTSTRPVRVALDGRTIAQTSFSMHLYETNLPVRFYMPLTSIDTSILRPSTTRTRCPYKGESEYHSVVVNGKEYKDIVWFYSRPTVECAAIAGMCCFYNEKVVISVQRGDGEWELLERPKTHFG